MQITILGTGTSQGVPVIGCPCEVCQSSNPKDKRLRCAIHVADKDTAIVVDAGPDFRQQMLREGIVDLDAIVITHEHNDHIIGLDDVRPFNFRQRKKMALYATEIVQDSIKERFSYAFEENPYPGAPGYNLHTISKETPFSIGTLNLQPIEVLHGKLPVLGFRFGDFTYITDAKTITQEELEKVKGTKILVLNALHQKPHYSHLNLDEALQLIDQIKPDKTYLTHVSHRMGLYDKVNKKLPQNVELAYDGLRLTMSNEP